MVCLKTTSQTGDDVKAVQTKIGECILQGARFYGHGASNTVENRSEQKSNTTNKHVYTQAYVHIGCYYSTCTKQFLCYFPILALACIQPKWAYILYNTQCAIHNMLEHYRVHYVLWGGGLFLLLSYIEKQKSTVLNACTDTINYIRLYNIYK